MTHPLRIEKLHRSHEIERLDCNSEPLNRYLIRFALQNQQAAASQTYLALNEKAVVGYYTLVVGQVEYDDAPDANVEEGAVETNRAKPRVLRGILTPLEILNDIFSFQLARPVHVPGFQKRAYRIPGLLVFRESVSFAAVTRFQERNDPSTKVFFVGNTSGVGLLLASFRFELARLSGFRADANTAASGLVADFSSGIAKLYPPVGRAIALVDRSHGVTECHQCHQFCQLLPKNVRV